tara:strand:- start:46003 stop:52398 length:6396 start_codon:yes stop_codon:yes gene_type:complete
MECNVLNIANGKKSELYDQLKEIFQDEQAAEIAYAKVIGPSFMKRFGDWEYNYKNSGAKDLKKIGLVADNGEPLLKQDLTNNMWFFTDKNGDRDYIDKYKFSEFTAQEVSEVTDHLLYRFVLEGGKKSFNNYDPTELEEGRILASIDRTIQAYKESIVGRDNEQELLERIELVEKNRVDFKNELISSIGSLGLKVRERITDAEGNPLTEIAEKDKGGGVNIKESFETNSKDTATVNTKIFLSQIEERVFAEDEHGDEVSVPVESGFLETPAFAKFDDVWNTLNKILVDEVGYGHGENVVDIFDVMYDKISDFQDTKLWMHDLLDKLKFYQDTNNTNKITEFVQAFSKTSLNYFVTQVDGGNYTVINATSTNSRQSQLTNKWNNAFVARFIGEKGNLADRERGILAQVLKDTRSSFRSWNQDQQLAGTDRASEAYQDAIYDAAGNAAQDLVGLLERLGATEITTDDVNTMIIMNGGEKKIAQTIDNLYKSLGFMLNDILSEGFQFSNDTGSFENVFNREVFTKAFAEAVGFRMTDMSDSSVLLNQGKSGYTVSNPTYISNKINEWKKDPSQLEDMMMDISKKNSEWLGYLLALDKDKGEERRNERMRRLDLFKAGLDSSFKSKGKNDGVENISITTNDQINANIVQMLNENIGGKSLFPTIIAADKSRRILFEGLPMFKSNIQSKADGGIYISPKAVDVAFGYFLDEYNRMKRVNRENKDENIKKVVHYHGDNGNGLKSQIFPEFNKDNTDPKYAELRAAIYGETFKDDKYEGMSSDQEKIVRQFIEQDLTDRVKEHVDKLNNLDGISEKMLDHYNNDMTALAGDYFMNGLISSVEYTKLFSGDPAYYKNNADLIKRIPATYTDGLQLRLENGDALRFNQATVSGVEVASKYVEKIRESVKDKSIAKAYERVNTTDAQAWITPRRWRFLKQKLGQWGPQHDKVYSKMRTGESMSPSEMKLAAQPLKGVYFEINEGRPVYLKYSQAVLIPSLVKGTPMESIYNKMTQNPETGKPYGDKEGHLEVHEVVTIDGIKVGAVEPTRINVDGTTDLLPEADIVLNPQILNNRGWKLQQDLPIKLMHDTNVGSQIQKNIFEGLSLSKFYTVDGVKTKGNTLAKEIHETVSKLSNLGKQEIKDKFGIDENNVITDKQYIYNALIEEFKDRGGNENVIDALQKQMPLDAIPQIKGKVESIFMSIMNRKMTKISTEGGSFIQVSPFGLETVGEDSGITIVSEDYNGEALLPPRIEKGKVLPGQAMITHTQAMKILKKHKIKLEGKDLKSAMALLDPSALELITYRIPNQGMSSNDYLQIVGVLPPGVGDSIVVYDGLPAKTGSDFDIDKLFAMQNSLVYDPQIGKLTKLTESNRGLAVDDKGDPLSDAQIEKMLTQNQLVAQYKAVLNSPHTYDAMMRSIDGAQLKDDIVGIKGKDGKLKGGLFPAVEMKNMELFSPLTQLETKSEYLSGKMGVGQTANHLVDHVMNQMLDVRLTKWIGVGNQREVTGKKGKKKLITFFDSETTGQHSIADNLSAFLNAYVDIAKDPYIARANHNSITANTTFMLLRAGADMKWVNRFIGQPILKELVDLQKEQMSITANDIMLKGVDGEMSKGNALDQIRVKYGFAPIPPNVTGATVAGLSESALEKNITSGKRDAKLDYEVLKAWSFLQEQGKIFGESVIAAKSDTAGAGGSNVDRLVNENKIRKILGENNLQGYGAKFQGTMLGTYAENTLDFVKNVVRASNLFLSGTQGAMDTYNAVSFQTANGDLLTDARLGKAIDGAFYSYIMSGTTLFKDNNKKYKTLTEDFPETIFNRQTDIVEGNAERNFLLEELEISTWKDKKYLGINNKNKPAYYENQVYRAWMDLYESYNYKEDGSLDTETIHPDKKLAIDLVRYAFLSSGFQNNLSQFFSFIPHQILKDFNISGEIRDAIMQADEMATDSEFVDQFQRHSKRNSKVVKSLNVGGMEGNKNLFIYRPAKNKSQEFGSVDGNSRFFPKFVNGRVSTYNPQTGWTRVDNYLYEQVGTVSRKDADGQNMRVPVYSRTFELGTTVGKFKSFEYAKGEKITESQVESNNVPPLVKLKAQEQLNEILNTEETFKDNNGRTFDDIKTDSVFDQKANDIQVIKDNLTQIIEDKKIKCK